MIFTVRVTPLYIIGSRCLVGCRHCLFSLWFRYSASEIESDLQMVELASKKFVCIVDESKLVEGLGGSKGERPTAVGSL